MKNSETPAIGIMSPGDMGHAVGNVLRHGGLRVATCLDGRSARTAALAVEAGIEPLPDLAALVRETDVLLSILPPARAAGIARQVALALRATGETLVYVDCNAISPGTSRDVGSIVSAAGGHYVDAGIIGGPPKPGSAGTRFYASGEHAGEFARLREFGLDVRVIGSEIGRASGLKMCYAALTKGLTALGTELLVAAHALGLSEPLRAEMKASQPTLLGILERSIPSMPPKAYRWVGEMEEIAETFGEVGLTPKIHEGAADLYRFVQATSLGTETPETRSKGTTLDEVIGILAGSLPEAVSPSSC